MEWKLVHGHERLFRMEPLQNEKNKIIYQCWNSIDTMIKEHSIGAQKAVAVSLLRTLHQTLDAGPLKSRVRGILCFAGRWDRVRTMVKICEILQDLQKEFGLLYISGVVEKGRLAEPADILLDFTQERLRTPTRPRRLMEDEGTPTAAESTRNSFLALGN